MFLARLIPQGWEERDDAVGIGCDLSRVSKVVIGRLYTYMVLHSLHNAADGIQQRHLRLLQLNLLHERHQSVYNNRGIRQEGVGVEFPLVCYILELSCCSDPNDLVVERVTAVHQMLIDLVDDGLLLLGDFDRNPLCDYDGDATTDDVIPWFLLLRLCNQGVRDERVKVEVVEQYVGSKANRSVDGVLEEDVFVVRCYSMLARKALHCLVSTHTRLCGRLATEAVGSNL
jgi:hypothetical protein